MTTNDKPTKERTPAIKAATAFNNITQLRTKRDAELAAAPDAIAQKYNDRIAKVRDELDAEARVILDRMLAE